MTPRSLLVSVAAVFSGTIAVAPPRSGSEPRPAPSLSSPAQVRVETKEGSTELDTLTPVSVARDGLESPGQLSHLEIELPAELSVPCTEGNPTFILTNPRTQDGRFGPVLTLALVDRNPSRHDTVVYNLPTSLAPTPDGGHRYHAEELAPQRLPALRERLLHRWMSVDRRKARAYVGVVWYEKDKRERRFYPIEVAQECPES